jgi:hypothetical protein
MAEEKKTVFVVKVVGKPGRGGRTTDKAYAEQLQDVLGKQHKTVRILEKKPKERTGEPTHE